MKQSALSNFVHNATKEEKRRMYDNALKASNKVQLDIIKKASRIKS